MKDEAVFKLVGERIRRLRKERGWTQDEISRRFGFNYKHYQRIEQGQQNLELATLNKLATAFEIPIDQILIFPCTEAKSVSRRKRTAGASAQSRRKLR